MAEGEDGDEDLENLWDLDSEDDFISEGSLDSVEGPEEDDAESELEDDDTDGFLHNLARVKCREDLEASIEDMERSIRWLEINLRPEQRWECPEDRKKAEEVFSISARKLFNLTSALNDWDRLTGDKVAELTLGVAAKTIYLSIVTRATQGEDCSKAALTDHVNLSKKTPKSIEARPATRPKNAQKRLARKKMVESYGAWGKEALESISQLASRLATCSSKAKSVVLTELYRRLNLHLVRANAIAILARSIGQSDVGRGGDVVICHNRVLDEVFDLCHSIHMSVSSNRAKAEVLAALYGRLNLNLVRANTTAILSRCFVPDY
eukprot:Em0017g686a